MHSNDSPPPVPAVDPGDCLTAGLRGATMITVMVQPDPVSHLLERVRAGDPEASAELFELVYGDLRARAHALLAGGAPQTLQATALVHEAWLKLNGPGAKARDRGHFMAVAAKAMRSVLVDAARARGTLKRDGERVFLDEALAVYSTRVPDVAELHDELDPRPTFRTSPIQ